MYADDLMFIFNVGKTEVIMNRIVEYLSQIGLKYAPEKTKIYNQ
jgi:hypothetical protein